MEASSSSFFSALARSTCDCLALASAAARAAPALSLLGELSVLAGELILLALQRLFALQQPFLLLL